MGAYDDAHDIPIIARGEGCYVWDEHGKRYLDGLSALFCVNIGHGRARRRPGRRRPGQGARLLHELVLRAPARDRARRPDRRLAPGRPQPRLLHLRRRRGRRVRDQAGPPVPQAHGPPEQDEDHRARDRLPRHDARRADRHRHHRTCASPSSRSRPAAATCPNTNLYRLAPRLRRGEPRRGDREADRVRGPRHRRGRDRRAGPERRRLLHAARRLLPARARDLRRVRRPAHLRRGHLLVGPARRVLRRRALRLPARPDHDGQGPDVRLRADGRRDRLRPRRRAVPAGHASFAARLHVRRAPDVPPRSRWRTSTSSRSEGILEQRARARGRVPRRCSSRCATSRSSATCAARATSRRSSWSRTARPRSPSPTTESETLLRGFLVGELFDRGLICRADDRGDPVIQLSPPLIAGPEQFAEIEAVLRPVLEEASERMLG